MLVEGDKGKGKGEGGGGGEKEEKTVMQGKAVCPAEPPKVVVQ